MRRWRSSGKSGHATAATLSTIATTGHDTDIIFESGLTAGAIGANGEIGSRQFFEDGATSATDDGLPRTLPSFLAASGNTIDYSFQPFEQSNILYFTLGTAAKTLTLTTPAAYRNLAVVHAGGSLGTTTEYGQLAYQINYAGGGTQTGVINSPDWGAVATLPPGTERIFTADRTTANATMWPVSSDNNTMANRWATYVSEIIPSNTSANIESITFGPNTLFVIATQTSGPLNSGDDLVVYGLAGTLVPEPSAAALAFVGALTVAARRRRRRGHSASIPNQRL